MPINSTSPVATKALSVASKKLCLSPVAWPSIRANSSLAASSLLQNWWPHCNSMTWTQEAHSERPQCRASKQYSALVSLLDLRPPSFPEPERPAGTACGRDVDVDRHRCAKKVFQNEQDFGTTHKTHDTIATNDGGSFLEGEKDEIYTRPAHGMGHLSDSKSSDQATHVPSTEMHDTKSNNWSHMKEGVAQCEQRLGMPEAKKLTQASPHPSTTLSYALVANPAIALNMARYDYECKVDRLERRCFELFVENQELRVSCEKAKASHAKTQELNLRLGREVQQARRESAAATEHLRQFEEKAHKTAVRSKRASAFRHQSTQTSTQCGIEVVGDTIDVMEQVVPQECRNLPTVPPPVSEGNHFACYPPGLESNGPVSTHIAIQEDAEHCCCDESHGWGCFHHRAYSSSLLLAHRQLRLAIAHGPPGLELPSDKLAQANSVDLGIHVASVASLMSSPNHSSAWSRM